MVLLQMNPVSSPLDNEIAKVLPLFEGPYQIHERLAKYTYMIKDLDRNKIIGKCHGDSLRKFKTLNAD